MNIGKNIIAFRKDAGMTQEDLANQIGVSAQAVSKWETGVSMPDILLLPVIADVFGITVDEIYTGKKENAEPKQAKHYSFSELPEVLYENLLEIDSYAWEHESEEERKKWLAEMKAGMEKESCCAHFSCGDRGGAVLATRDLALIDRTFGTKESLEIMNSPEKALPVLEVLFDEKVRCLFRYLLEVKNKMFTAAAVAKKVGMTEEDCRAALDKMSAVNLIYVRNVEVDTDEELKVYSVVLHNTTVLYICTILRLAERIRANEWFYGYRGMYLPVDREK